MTRVQCTSLFWVAIESVFINAELSSILFLFVNLNCFGGMSDFITDKIGQILLETVNYGRVELEIVFTMKEFKACWRKVVRY